MNQTIDFEKIRRFSADIRKETTKAIGEAGFGHIGGSVSIADVLAVLYGGMMKIEPADPNWEERDWLILSKGHCAPGLYAALALSGYFPMEWLKTINKPGTNLPSHADCKKVPGVDMTTGSLGQGIRRYTVAGARLSRCCRTTPSSTNRTGCDMMSCK